MSGKVDPSAALISRLAGNAALINTLPVPSYGRDAVKLKRLDRLSLQVSDVNYTVPSVMPTQPLAVGTQWATNCSSVEQQMSIQFDETKGNTVTHEFSYGFTEGVSAGLTAGLPGVAEATVTASLEFNQNISNSTSTTVESTWSTSVPTNVVPGKKLKSQLVVTNYIYDKIPFTAHAFAQGQALLSYEYFDQLTKRTIPGQVQINLEQFLDAKGRSFDLKGTLNGAISGKSATVNWGPELNVQASDCQTNSPAAAAAPRRDSVASVHKDAPNQPVDAAGRPGPKVNGTIRVRR